jgi:hypothetical protein
MPHSGSANPTTLPTLTTAYSTLLSHLHLPPTFHLQPILFTNRTPDPTLPTAFDGFLTSVCSRLRISLGRPRQSTDQIPVERRHRTLLHLAPSADELLCLHSLLDRACNAVRSKRNNAYSRLPTPRPRLCQRPRRPLRILKQNHGADYSSAARSIPFLLRTPIAPLPIRLISPPRPLRFFPEHERSQPTSNPQFPPPPSSDTR